MRGLSDNRRQWFAVQTKVGREEYTREQYERQGFAVYLPMTLRRCRHAGRVDWKKRPFFPGYLFLHLAPEECCWTTIRSTYGAIGAVHFGNHYPTVPEIMIDTLRSRQNDAGLINMEHSGPDAPFRHGERIKVIRGPMSDVDGIFQCMKGRERVVLLMQLLGRQSRVELPVELVA